MLRIREGFVMRNILDEWIIVPIGARATSETYIMSVNESGHMLWEMLEQGATEADLLAKMLEEYEVDEATAKGDLDEFLARMKEKDVLEDVT